MTKSTNCLLNKLLMLIAVATIGVESNVSGRKLYFFFR